MAKQKRKNQELLDEVVFEFVLCMFRDLVHITVLLILKCDENYYSKIEVFAQNSEDYAIHFAQISRNLLQSLIKSGHGRVGIVFYFGHAACGSKKYNFCDTKKTNESNLNDKETTKETTNMAFLLPIFLVCLKCASVHFGWSLHELSSSSTFHIDVEFSNSSSSFYYIIDETSEFHNRNGISFVHFPRVLNFENEYLVSEYTMPQNSLLKSSFHTVLGSNSTATGTLFSLEDKLLSGFITFVYRVLLYTMVLTVPLLVGSSPLENHTLVKETKERDRKSTPRSFVVDLKGAPNTGYCANMKFGNSVSTTQEFCMLVDTGSSNLAVAAAPLPEVREYLNTQTMGSSLVKTEQTVTVSYSGGEWSGTLAREQVSIGGSPPVEAEFALIQSASTFFIPGAEWVGILGLAYDSLAKPDSSVTPFWSTLQKSSGLPNMFTIRICPPLDSVNKGGILEFGDISDTLYTGPILYTSIVQELYYNVLVTSLTVGSVKIDLPCYQFNNDKAIVDSGTTDIYLPTETFDAVVTVFRAHFKEDVPLKVPDEFWEGELKISWPSENINVLFEAFPNFFIGLATDEDSSREFALAVTPQTYLRQVAGSREEMIEAKCSPHCSFFVFGIKSREKGMVIGGNVMLGFTTVFDREKRRVGFAKSTCNYIDDTPGHIPYIVEPYPRVSVDCECHGCSYSPAYWELIVYTCGAIVTILCIISTIHTIVIKCYRRNRYADCCCRTSSCCRQNTISARSVIATEENECEPVTMERRSSLGSTDSGFDSPNSSFVPTRTPAYTSISHVTIVSCCVEEENSSTADSYVSPSFAANGTCTNNIKLLTKPPNTVHALVPRLSSILLFSC